VVFFHAATPEEDDGGLQGGVGALAMILKSPIIFIEILRAPSPALQPS
jgi:hypothetical protein